MYSFPDIDVRLGIEGPAQEHNASLAVQLVSAWMKRHQLQSRWLLLSHQKSFLILIRYIIMPL